jgi:phage-related protein
LQSVGKYDYITSMKPARAISWIKAARKAFEAFPPAVQVDALRALTIAAEGEKADTAKPLQGLGAGVMEIALRHRGDAWRVVYAVQFGDDLWVIHAFQKKSKSGIATPAHEIELVRERLKRLQEMLNER